MVKNLEDSEFWLPSNFLCDDLFLDGGEKNGSAEVAGVVVGCFSGELRYGFVSDPASPAELAIGTKSDEEDDYMTSMYVRALSFLPSSSPLRGSLDLLFSPNSSMYVMKRDGRHESVHFYKITARLKKLRYGLSQDHCNPILVAQKVCAGVYKGVTTRQLDELAAETTVAMTANHPNYALLVARIAVSNLQKNTKKSF